MKNRKISKIMRYVFWVVGIGALFFAAFAIFILPSAQRVAKGLPKNLMIENKKHNVQYAGIEMISPYILDAAVASQDRRFYSNWGVDPIATVRAIVATITTRERQGASTITEQLIKNVYFKDKDTPATDVKTKLIAPFVTADYAKQYILEMYLNGIYFGQNAYGIYQASEIYFHTTPDNVSLAQAVYLMGLVNAPSYFDTHRKQAANEAGLVLSEMARDRYISASQEKNAEAELQRLGG